MNEAVLYVIYRGDPADRFDRAYYSEHHLPLVRDAFTPHGLVSLAAFYPAQHAPGTIALCECRFIDAPSIGRAFGSPEAAPVMADIPRFTDLQPIRLSAIPL
ncbi:MULTISPECIES: EthD family reductase [Asaia]|uniref:Ethyl tert-butyl ether degradation EthD n=1 Tax=Asaia bogorensis TaxID=91915 RepID=A0A060QG93_9PROT|nr:MULTISPECIES: EthD family reductase [Asaia]ETC99673.1 ethyl tert-butyl ether degradation protein EthD [Asaia sp. SF2.1]MDL2169746.1 EthD family reductase [Asaia sp. HumB]CDG39673.1 Ethyl tert-butyl ether degradation EthD [Asaia bogorensis]